MIELAILESDGQERERRLFPGGRVRVGRMEGNDLVLEDPYLGRSHLAISAQGGRYQLECFSRAGFAINGVPVPGADSRRASPGDIVQVGQSLLRLGMLPVPGDIDEPVFSPSSRATSPAPALRVAGLPAEPTPPTATAVPSSSAEQAGRERARDRRATLEVKKRLHAALLEYLSLRAVDLNTVRDEGMRERARVALEEILERRSAELPAGLDRESLAKEILDEALGLGPLQDLLGDESITEIMVVSRDQIFVERAGVIEPSDRTFTSDDAVRAVIERIVTPLGRRIDESTPLVDARLRDGSRVNAVIPPLALKGPTITIRKFPAKPLTMDDLLRFGSLDERMARFLSRCVRGRRNIIISGGTGSGKTTLLNVLSGLIDPRERVITIEDAAELRLQQPHVVSLETRPPNVEGRGEYSIRDLVKNALRMRPDRIVVGECRSGEALDMLQAMNTGHEGSMTTGHANAPEDMIARLETMVLMAGLELPLKAVRQQIASAVDVIVQQTRMPDHSRKITHITEVVEVDEEGRIRLEDIFRYEPGGPGRSGRFLACGYMPGFMEELERRGLLEGGGYL